MIFLALAAEHSAVEMGNFLTDTAAQKNSIKSFPGDALNHQLGNFSNAEFRTRAAGQIGVLRSQGVDAGHAFGGVGPSAPGPSRPVRKTGFNFAHKSTYEM